MGRAPRAGGLLVLPLVYFAPVSRAAPVDLQIAVQSTCEIPGTAVEIAIRVDGTDATVVAGQFSVAYDADAFAWIDLEPGSSCDLASPFTTLVFQSVDPLAGTAFAAMGVELGAPAHVLDGPVTVACLRLLPLSISTSDVCLVCEPPPRLTKFIDAEGQPLQIAGLIEPAPDSAPVNVACTTVQVDPKCECTPGGNECEALSTACRLGVCASGSGVCAIQPTNEGGPCDDGNACTTRDVCESGQCVGHDCANPSLCLASQECGRIGEMRVAVRMGASDIAIAGGQFSVQYDPAGLEFVSLLPGAECSPGSPFSTTISTVVDEVGGEVFSAVGIGLDQLPTMGPAIVACLSFNVLDGAHSEVCTFLDVNPRHTYLVGENQELVTPFNGEECPTDRPFPYTSCIEYEFCPIPAVSTWGLLILSLLLATMAKVSGVRRRLA